MKDYKYSGTRNVPQTVKIAILFGGVFPIIGLGFTLIGLLITVPFSFLVSFDDWSFSPNDPYVFGKLIKTEQTGATDNEQPVYAYHFQYKTFDGITHQNISFSTEKNKFRTVSLK